MKRQFLAAAASACFLSAPLVEGALINGDFETGDFTGWLALPLSQVVSEGGSQDRVHTGNWAAQLGPGFGNISQLVPLVAGETYKLTFWARNSTDISLQVLASIVGLPVSTLFINPTTTWTEYTHVFTPSLNGGAITFTWGDENLLLPPNSKLYLDDISLTPVPEPTTIVAGALLLLPFATQLVRQRRRPAAS